MTEVMLQENIHERGRPRWSRMRSRLLDEGSENIDILKEQDIAEFLNANLCISPTSDYIFTTKERSHDITATKHVDEKTPRKKKHRSRAAEPKKTRRKKDLEVKFTNTPPIIIGEGGDEASLPANQVAVVASQVLEEIEPEPQPWETQLLGAMQVPECDAASILPPTVNCSTVKRRPRVRRIPTSYKVKAEQDDATVLSFAEASQSKANDSSLIPQAAIGNHFIDKTYPGLYAPSWQTNSQGWPEPSVPGELRRMQADEGRVLMNASRNGHRSTSPSPEVSASTILVPAPLRLKDDRAHPGAVHAPVLLERQNSNDSYMSSDSSNSFQIPGAHPAALSLRPRASPRASVLSLVSQESSASLKRSSQCRATPRQDSTPSRASSKKSNRHTAITKAQQQVVAAPECHQKPGEQLMQLSPQTYVPPTPADDTRPGRTRVRRTDTQPSEHKSSGAGKPPLPEKSANRSHLAALPDCTRRPSAAAFSSFSSHREEAFSALVHPAFRRSSTDSIFSRSSTCSKSPRRRPSHRSSRNPSVATISKANVPSPNESTTVQESSDHDDTYAASDAMTSFLTLTAHLTSQISLPSLALPLSKHSTLKWLQTAIYWFLRGRQGLTKYILLLRNGAPAGSCVSSVAIANLLTQQHVNFFKTWWVIDEVVRERLVSLAGSGEMYARQQQQEGEGGGGGGGGEGEKHAELFELADILVERFREVVAWLMENEMLPSPKAAAEERGMAGGRAEEQGKTRGGAGGKLDMCLWFCDEGFTDDLAALRERLVRPWRV